MVMKNTTSFALGLVIILPISMIISWFINNVLESILNRGLHDDYVIFVLIILLPILFYFFICKSMNFKQKIVRILSFMSGILFLGFLFFIGLARCYEQKECWFVHNVSIYGVIGLALVYLIFRFIIYLRNKKN